LTPGSGFRDTGWVKIQDPDPGSGSGMNIPDHISESLETIYLGLKILKFFEAEQDQGSGIFSTMDPGWKKFGSGIKIPDPQHCYIPQ